MNGPFDVETPLDGEDPFKEPPPFPKIMESETPQDEGKAARKVEGPRTSSKRNFFEPTRDERAHRGDVDVEAEELFAVAADYLDELGKDN